MAAKDVLGAQWTPKSPVQAREYPTKGWRKASDPVTAQQKLMGASRGYDVHTDLIRKGITPSMN